MNRQWLVAGVAAIALGLGGGAAMYLRPEALRVPAWVGISAMGAFVAAGGALIASACEANRLQGWLGVLTVAGLIIPFLWIALGPGPMNCSLSMPFLAVRRALGHGA